MPRRDAPSGHDIAKPELADKGKKRILWADRDMPVLRTIRERFEKEKPLAGLRMSACLHVTAETANLARTLKAGGADLVLIASNPLSHPGRRGRQPRPGLRHHRLRHPRRGHRHLLQARRRWPWSTSRTSPWTTGPTSSRAMIFIALDRLDDVHAQVRGVGREARRRPSARRGSSNVIGSMEETTTGVIRLRAMEKDGVLKFPVIAVNDAETKHFFDNRYGTGQSTIDGVIRATNMLHRRQEGRRRRLRLVRQGRRAAGPRAGRAGHRHRGRPDPRPWKRRWTASRSCRWPRRPRSATCSSPSPATSTSSAGEHFAAMKDGAMVCNSGHFDVELDLAALKAETAADDAGRPARGRRVQAEERQAALRARARAGWSTWPPPRATRRASWT